LWNAFCSAAAAHPDGKSGSAPGVARQHECCLGLAHATAFVEPPSAFVIVEPAAALAASPLPSEQPTSVGIRDGPSQPRGPPLPV
jgi:hypothetical protein